MTTPSNLLVQVSTDHNIVADEALTARMEGLVASILDRFSEHVTRAEVHLSDENGPRKSGADDKRCVIEVRLPGHQPIVATDNAATIDQAARGAADKVKRQLISVFGKMADRVTSYSPADPPSSTPAAGSPTPLTGARRT